MWPATSLARSLIRFIHAVPAGPTLSVEAGTGAHHERIGLVAFARAAAWRSLRTGRFRWELVNGSQVFSSGNATVGRGAFDAVLFARRPAGVRLGLFRTRPGRPGVSLLRVIHAAPELGSPALELDGRLLAASLSYTHATPYVTVRPGLHALSAMRLGSATPLVAVRGVRLVPGVAYSSILVGSAGRRLRWVTVTDRGAPLVRPTAPTGMSGGSGVTVRPGDSLWTIAAHHLGPSATNEQIYYEVAKLWRLNAHRIGTGDPSLIFPGQRVYFS